MIKEIKPKAAPKVRKPAKIKKEVGLKETAEKEVKEVEGIKEEVKEMKTETADKIEISEKAETAEKTEKIGVVEAVNAAEEGESAEENGKNPKSNRYYEAVGRRKTAIARVSFPPTLATVQTDSPIRWSPSRLDAPDSRTPGTRRQALFRRGRRAPQSR